jgi:hypothetical protein
MRILICSIAIGQLILVGALSVAAAQPVSSAPQIQSTAGSDATTNRGTYTQRAQGDMREWQQKLRAFSEKAKAKGEKAGNMADNDLNAAWTKTQEEARKLQTASAEGWASARISYERASHELADVWDRSRP